MKKFLLVPLLFIAMIFLVACSEEKATPASIAGDWCDLNAKAHTATDGPAKESAVAARKKFEDDITAKYDKAFMEEVGKEVEKCEDASEGRK